MDEICKSCGNKVCIFQYGVERHECSFFIPKTDKKIGQWSLIIGGDPKYKYICNQCMGTACEITPFCPYCGAKMESEG